MRIINVQFLFCFRLLLRSNTKLHHFLSQVSCKYNFQRLQYYLFKYLNRWYSKWLIFNERYYTLLLLHIIKANCFELELRHTVCTGH